MEGIIMMLTAEELATKKFILSAKGTFEDMASTVIRTTHSDRYTMLNYEEILEKMCDYIESYVDYKKTGDEKYRGKVLATTRIFYDSIFTEKKFRKKLTLKQISKTNEVFLKGTKEFQAVMEKYIEKQDQDYELQEMLILSNNQYKKLSKVYNDDMKIFMWLATGNSNMYNYSIDPRLRAAYYDLSTPVIHSAKQKERHIADLDDISTNDSIDDEEE
jgi:hypothetical protein